MASPGKKSFLLRVPPDLMEAVERLAASELRSTNAQLEVLIREAMAKRGIRVEAAKRRRIQEDEL
jgi:hypothetical protein